VALVSTLVDSGAAVPALLLLLVLGALAWQLSWMAGRLDRLHHRVEATAAALDAQLLRRATAAAELAGSGLLDPATSLLVAGAAAEAVAAGEGAGDGPEGPPGAARERAESDLSRALRAALPPSQVAALAGDPLGQTLLEALGRACHRVLLARRFHNAAVVAAQRVRRKRLVRAARLAGRAPLPRTFEMDDDPPPDLTR
jgi:hypothetical protein